MLGLLAKGGLALAKAAPLTTGLAVGVPVVGTLMGAEDRKYELVQEGERGGKHNLSLTDRIFSPLTGINEQSVDAAKVAYLNDQLGPEAAKYGMTPNEDGNYFSADDTLAGARVKVDTAGTAHNKKTNRTDMMQLQHDMFMSPQQVEERRIRDERYNQTLIQRAEDKLEAEKIRAADRAENRELLAQQGIQASEDRKLTLQLEAMRDKRAFADRQGKAQMAMVAALAGSLGDLGTAFASI